MRINFRVTGFFERRSRLFRLLFGIFLYAATTLLKYVAGPEMIFSALYLVPVSFLTWFVSIYAGVVIALASAASMLILNLAFRGTFRHAATPYWNAIMDLGIFLFSVVILGQLKDLLAREAELSRRDALTALHNRRGLVEALDRERMAARRHRRPFTVIYIDSDNFKRINDTQGHVEGDRVLCACAHVLRSNTRDIDVVARIGGDEFAMLLPETDAASARTVLEKLQTALRSDLQASKVTYSIGAATFTGSAETAAEVLSVADDVMYRAKSTGKNRYLQINI